MKTKEITVTSRGDGMDEALEMTEALGRKSGLGRKENLRLRLLAEELFGTMKSIAGDVEGIYYVEKKDTRFDICMKAQVILTAEMREQFLSVSSTGKNAAAKSFMGKIRDMITTVVMSMNSDPTMLQMGIMSAGSPIGYQGGLECYEWYMNKYKEAVRDSDPEGESEAWDELEKSIVANLADDVSISIVRSEVEVKITKTF